MVSMIEARSLSTLADLAANPPVDPGQPLQGGFSPLTLYIARVPGSRDIFLTTLKTKDKVVSAHDIGSCLYYLHVNIPEDELLEHAILAEASRSNESDIHVPDTVLEEDTTVINRKPLPQPLVLVLGDRPRPSSKTYSDFRPSLDSHEQARAIERRPVSTNLHQSSNGLHVGNPSLPRRPPEAVPPPLPVRENAKNLMPALPPRRLQGPRPIHSRNESVDTASLGRGLREENMNPRRWSEQPNPPRDRSMAPESRRGNSGYLTEHARNVTSKNSSLSITIIRRDPATGEQWNVGRIIDSLANRDFDNSPHGSGLRCLQDGVLVELDTPGYHKFAENRTLGDSNAVSNSNPARQPSDIPDTKTETGTFRRLLQIRKSKLVPDSTLPRRYEFGSNLDKQGETRPSIGLSESCSQASYIKPHNESNSSSYCSFLSPWRGNCTFATGATGKSLKCRHLLPLELQTRPNNTSLDSTGLLVSELRFNLPNSNVFKLKSRDNKRPILSKLSGSRGHHSNPQLSPRLHGRPNTPQAKIHDVSSEEDEKMDLSLGQERAGGGFGGKKAKLGKLILESEGLKMLDLLVAVNMAIWWKVYE